MRKTLFNTGVINKMFVDSTGTIFMLRASLLAGTRIATTIINFCLFFIYPFGT